VSTVDWLGFPPWERIMGDVGGLLDTAPVSRAAVLEERYRSRLPETLEDLTGPGHGIVQLPLYVAWSGQTDPIVGYAASSRSKNER
jgi:hypothetical protein